MALILVVVNDFGTYRRGAQITNPTVIDAIRTGEFSNQVVMVGDTIIPPPVSPNTPDYNQVVAAYQELVAQIAEQQAALNAATSLNAQQNTALAVQSGQIGELTNAVNVLAAKVANPNGGNPIAPDLADDLPLAENDGVVLVTNAGAVLVGDIR